MAKKEAITPLHRQIKDVLQVLESIIHNHMTNAVTVSSAKELLIQIDFLCFLCLLDFWCQILSLIDRENKLLQSKTISIDITAKKMKGLKASIQNLRDVGVDNIIKDATEKAYQSEIDGDFPIKRKRKVKRMALYEAENDSHLLKAKTEFRSQCNLVFDSIILQIEWRFEAVSAVSSDFDFFNGHSLSKSSVDELKKKAVNLSQIYKADLDSSDFQSEMASFKYQDAAMMDNFEKSSPINILQLIHKYSLTDAYPNTAIAIRIFLTIPVTVATRERSFSELKLIKNYKRSTMGQERMSSLAKISIENEMTNNIDFDDVINVFATRKARKKTLN
ncbi:zinc finger MYM-type protein 1-like [Hydra vulgaris]|uniref:Zinc finger MYM-type protein 1-like n=1 Tax=Hydra vulgaris TaxID=6087 RepID=A0ABM4B2F1_HYDVU